MTRNPGPLLQLQAHFEARIGPYWKGTVGDPYHFYGYHLGADEVLANDYSVIHPRDAAGVAKYGGFFASAVDIGMGWPASRTWLRWLIDETSAGKFPDIREIIGSTDGVVDYVWDTPSRDVWEHSGQEHINHTHISFFRDSIFRGHLYLFDTWTAHGRAVSTTGIGSNPTPIVPSASPSAVVPTPTPEAAPHPVPIIGPRSLACALGVGALAWVIKRRMEIAREDT